MSNYSGSWILLVPFTIALFGCDKPAPKQEEVRPVKAERIPDPILFRSKPFPGVTRAEERVNLAFRVAGPLVEFPVNVGSRVKKGEMVARIDPRDFEVELENAKARLGTAEAALAFAKSDYERALKIQKRDPGAISQSMVERKREEQNRLAAEVRSKEAELSAAEDRLGYTYLKAPFDGVVVAKYLDNYEYVRAEQPVARVMDASNIEMVVDIPEHLIANIPYVTSVTVTLDVMPEKTFCAKIKEVGTEASAVTRTFPVTLLLRPPKGIRLFAGMSGEAEFKGKVDPEDTERLYSVIPVEAVFSDKSRQKSFVWVIDEDSHSVERREVVLGKLMESGVQVKEGLSSGEWIAVAGVNFIKDGQKVRILE